MGMGRGHQHSLLGNPQRSLIISLARSMTVRSIIVLSQTTVLSASLHRPPRAPSVEIVMHMQRGTIVVIARVWQSPHMRRYIAHRRSRFNALVSAASECDGDRKGIRTGPLKMPPRSWFWLRMNVMIIRIAPAAAHERGADNIEGNGRSHAKRKLRHRPSGHFKVA